MDEKYLMKLARVHGYLYGRDENGELYFEDPNPGQQQKEVVFGVSSAQRGKKFSRGASSSFLDKIKNEVPKQDLLGIVKNSQQLSEDFKSKKKR